jgi:3-dehydroquinate dehydratase-1
MAEIRLDTVAVDVSKFPELFSFPRRLIATCRPGKLGENERAALLVGAMAAGASLVDIELGSPAAWRREIVNAALGYGCRVVVSEHNHERTPPLEELKNIMDACFAAGADIAKIACRVRAPSDCARIFSLYAELSEEFGGRLIAIGMGEMGTITRVAAPFLGAPFTYASPVPGMETAEGQLDRVTLAKIYSLMEHG